VQYENQSFKNTIKNNTFTMYFLSSKFIISLVVEPFLGGF